MEQRWHENGQLERKLTYFNGRKEGLDQMWYENGQLESDKTYFNGKSEGLWQRWHENGEARPSVCVRRGLIEYMSYCTKG